MSRLFREMNAGARRAIEEDGRWLICESAIVAENEDPEMQHRLKVIIPSIDENLVFDEWIRCAGGVCLGDKLGSVFIPPKGAEVLVTGILGQKYNLVYHAATYNEDMLIPTELGIDTPGIKVPQNLSFIAGLVAKILANEIQIIAQQLAKFQGNNVEVIATALAKTTGQNIQSTASSENKVTGQTVKLESSTLTINGDGSITITGGAVQITGSSIKLFNRTVNQAGPPI